MHEPKVCAPTPLYINWKIDTLVCARRISSTKVAGSLWVRLYGRINRNGDFLPWLMGSLAVQMCLPALSWRNQSVCKWRWAAIRRFYPETVSFTISFFLIAFPFLLAASFQHLIFSPYRFIWLALSWALPSYLLPSQLLPALLLLPFMCPFLSNVCLWFVSSKQPHIYTVYPSSQLPLPSPVFKDSEFSSS